MKTMEAVPHEGFYTVDWDTGKLWQRIFTIPSITETAVIALQHCYSEESRSFPELFNYSTELPLAFATGHDSEEAMHRLLSSEPDKLSDITGEAGRALGRLLKDTPMAQMIFDTVTERGLEYLVFSIPAGAPVTKYQQFAKTHGLEQQERSSRYIWIKRV